MTAKPHQESSRFVLENTEARTMLAVAGARLRAMAILEGSTIELTINPDWIPPLDRPFKLR